MQRIKYEILGQIFSNEARNYIQKHIFSDQPFKKQPNAFLNNFDSTIHLNSSSMFSSYLTSAKYQAQKDKNMPIKVIVNRIQKLIALNGFYKTLEEINLIKSKTTKLHQKNEELQKILEETYKEGEKVKMRTSEGILKEKGHKKSQLSNLQQIMSFREQIQEAQQKLEHQKMKENMLQIIKLNDQQKLRLLEKTKKEYEQIKGQTQRIERVIKNIEKIHPDEAWLGIEVEELQKEYEEKSMLLESNGQRLLREIERLEDTIKILQRERVKRVTGKESLMIQGLKTQKNAEREASQEQQAEYNLLSGYLSSLEGYIRQQNEQKAMLTFDIKSFNQRYAIQKMQRQGLLKKIKQNFYNSSELIDQLIRRKENSREVDFVFKELGIEF